MAISFYQLEAKLSGTLLNAVAKELLTTSMQFSFVNSDDGTARVPDPDTKLFEFDPSNSQTGKKSEYILCESHSTTDGVTTLINVKRGLPRDATLDLVSDIDLVSAWDAGTVAGVVTEPFNINLVKAYLEGTEPIPSNLEFDGDLTFNGDNTYNGLNTYNGPINVLGTSSYIHFPNLTTVQRDALTPTSGMVIFNTTEGNLQVYQGGIWSDLDTGVVTPNASTTVAGKVEIATSSESVNGTDTGGTGALLSVLPSDLAKNAQNNIHVYAATSTGTDAYAITCTPPIPSYQDGQTFYVKLDVVNVGPGTLNVDGKGAVSYKRTDGSDPVNGDLPANKIIKFTYNSTGPIFQIDTPVASLTGGGDAGGDHFHKKGTANDSWNVTGNGQTSVQAHGLGRLPKIVTIYWGTTASSVDLGDLNHGTILYDGTTQRNLRYNSLAAGHGQFGATTGACTVRIDNVAQFSFAVTFDSTNVTLTSSAYSNSKTVDYIWVAE